MTFSFWIKGTATTGSRFYPVRFYASSSVYLETKFTKTATNDTLAFNLGDSTPTPTSYTYNVSLLDNTYHHIVWSISSGGTWYAYVDNTLIINGTINVFNSLVTTPSYTTKYIGYIDTATNTGTHSISVEILEYIEVYKQQLKLMIYI